MLFGVFSRAALRAPGFAMLGFGVFEPRCAAYTGLRWLDDASFDARPRHGQAAARLQQVRAAAGTRGHQCEAGAAQLQAAAPRGWSWHAHGPLPELLRLLGERGQKKEELRTRLRARRRHV